MKAKNERIVPICAFCEHARIAPVENEKAVPPLLFSLKADLYEEEHAVLTCPYKKEAAPDFSCRRFRFDPLKYRPKAAPAMPTLDEDALLLD